MIERLKMKQKTLTVNGIEKKLIEMGGIEISEEEFNTSPEYKAVSSYVNNFFRGTKPPLGVHKKSSKRLKKKALQ